MDLLRTGGSGRPLHRRRLVVSVVVLWGCSSHRELDWTSAAATATRSKSRSLVVFLRGIGSGCCCACCAWLRVVTNDSWRISIKFGVFFFFDDVFVVCEASEWKHGCLEVVAFWGRDPMFESMLPLLLPLDCLRVVIWWKARFRVLVGVVDTAAICNCISPSPSGEHDPSSSSSEEDVEPPQFRIIIVSWWRWCGPLIMAACMVTLLWGLNRLPPNGTARCEMWCSPLVKVVLSFCATWCLPSARLILREIRWR